MFGDIKFIHNQITQEDVSISQVRSGEPRRIIRPKAKGSAPLYRKNSMETMIMSGRITPRLSATIVQESIGGH